MAPNVTRSNITNNADSVLLKIVADDIEMTLITRNVSTNALSSDYLSDAQLFILSQRLSLVTSQVAAADVATISSLLASMLVISDVTGALAAQGENDGETETLKLVNMVAASTYYVVVSVPHSHGPLFGPAPL